VYHIQHNVLPFGLHRVILFNFFVDNFSPQGPEKALWAFPAVQLQLAVQTQADIAVLLN